MSVPALCTKCGLQFSSRMFGARNSTVTFEGCSESCPQCGGVAKLQDGTYTFVGEVITAFQAASRDDIVRFRNLAAQAANGQLSVIDAQREAAGIGPAFGNILQLALQWGIPSLLVAIVALYLQITSAKNGDASGEAILRELKAQNATNELVLDQLRRLTELQSTATPPPYSPQKPSTSQSQPSADAASNRHHRRRAQIEARRTPKVPKAPMG